MSRAVCFSVLERRERRESGNYKKNKGGHCLQLIETEWELVPYFPNGLIKILAFIMKRRLCVGKKEGSEGWGDGEEIEGMYKLYFRMEEKKIGAEEDRGSSKSSSLLRKGSIK